MTRTAVIRGLLIAFAVYVACAGLARLIAALVVFHPHLSSRRAPAGMQKIQADDGTEIAIVHLPNPRARFTIWFFHGNAEDLGDVEPWLWSLHDAGFAVFAADYPGYGLSGGSPSESSVYASTRAARDYLRLQLNVSPEQTLLYGRSVGGGPAVQLAAEERVGGLILQSTFTSVYRVLTHTRVLPFDMFENERKLARVTCPVLVMHGRRDEVIPFSHGETLYAIANEPKRSLWVPDAAHNDFLAVAGASHWQALRDFSDLCAEQVDSKR